MKSRLTGKVPGAGQAWGQEKKGVTEDETVGWHHQFNGHEFQQTPGDGEGHGSLACCGPCSCRARHDVVTDRQNRTLSNRISGVFLMDNRHLGSEIQSTPILLSSSLAAKPCPAPWWPHRLCPTRLLCPRDFPDKNARQECCHFLLQGVFPTQLSNLRLLHCRGILYHWATWEAVNILRWPITYSCSLQKKSMIYFYGSSTCYCSSESTTLTKFSWHKVFDIRVMLKLGIRNSEEIRGMYTATSPLPTSHIFMSTLRNSIKPHIPSKISIQVSFPLTVDFLGFFKLQSNFQIVVCCEK